MQAGSVDPLADRRAACRSLEGSGEFRKPGRKTIGGLVKVLQKSCCALFAFRLRSPSHLPASTPRMVSIKRAGALVQRYSVPLPSSVVAYLGLESSGAAGGRMTIVRYRVIATKSVVSWSWCADPTENRSCLSRRHCEVSATETSRRE